MVFVPNGLLAHVLKARDAIFACPSDPDIVFSNLENYEEGYHLLRVGGLSKNRHFRESHLSIDSWWVLYYYHEDDEENVKILAVGYQAPGMYGLIKEAYNDHVFA